MITPTTKEINDNIISQLQSSLNQTIPLLPKSFLRVLAKALSGLFILLYKYGGFTFLQVFVSTASTKETVINGISLTPLIEWGRLVGVGDPTAATSAELSVSVTVTNQTGFLTSGTQLIGDTNGVVYLVLGSVPLTSATVTATVQAVSDQSGGDGTGTIGNLTAGETLSFANPLPNVDKSVTVLSQVVTAADAEDMEVYRQRVIDRFQKRPQGGAYADYEIWGESVEGILNVYPYTGAPGEVDVYSEATVASSGSADGIPTSAQLQQVKDAINFDQNGLASRRNANAFVNSLPITRTSFDVSVSGLTSSDLASAQADIESALTEYFLSAEPFIAGLSIPPRKDGLTRVSISAIIENVAVAYGGSFSFASFYETSVGSGSLSAYTLGEGEKAKLGNVVFI